VKNRVNEVGILYMEAKKGQPQGQGMISHSGGDHAVNKKKELVYNAH
jgi:hypothetical protein